MRRAVAAKGGLLFQALRNSVCRVLRDTEEDLLIVPVLGMGGNVDPVHILNSNVDGVNNNLQSWPW
jgi:hypothetical protein